MSSEFILSAARNRPGRLFGKGSRRFPTCIGTVKLFDETTLAAGLCRLGR